MKQLLSNVKHRETRSKVHKYTYIHTYIQTFIHTYRYAYIHTYTHDTYIHTHILCVRGALSCQSGDRGQSEYHSEKAKKVYAQGI